MKSIKSWLFDAIAIVAFAAISFAYFFPADIEGRILYQHDTSAGRELGEEAMQYYQQTGERTRWSNSVFSGMPTYQTAPSYNSTDQLQVAVKAYHLWLPENVWFVFVYLLGFYIMLRAFNYRQTLAALGAIIWAFSSYFFIIIAAGHLWKVMALAYLPPIIGGVVLAYRGEYLKGFILTAIFSAFEINANHVQMTYYYLFIILFMVIAFLVDAIRQRQMTQFVKATAVCVVAALIGVCVNLSNLYHTWQYQKESMRGKSELVKADGANQSGGLDRDYITQWSYGKSETWTLLVPNTKGGASVPMANNEIVRKNANPEFLPIYEQMGQYWGEQPGTSGPVYVGAFVLMLFVMALFLVKGPMKWALLAATILSILLSWGKNFMGLTDFFIDHVPMYAKFRTVASILVIAEFTIPLLAVMALKRIVDNPDILRQTKGKTALYVALGATGGVALLFALFPTVFFSDFISSQEQAMITQGLPQEYVGPLMANLSEVRQAIFTHDCWRTVLIITIGFGLLQLYKVKKMPAFVPVILIALLCLVDMWTVNKRYLNDSMFVQKSVRENPQQKTAIDEEILKDQTLDYRVLNFNNTFNENQTAFFHKSIGGYHPAKLRRYQDMIDAYIQPEMIQLIDSLQKGINVNQFDADKVIPVINMLNTRYLTDRQQFLMPNPHAFGNAWMVDKVVYVDNANAELDEVGKIALRHEAVADQQFKDILGQALPIDSADVVTMKSYQPNQLEYEVKSKQGGIVVFSEVYYPGWKASVDGQETDIARVNYLLRAIRVAPGTHQVTLSFFPASINVTETIAYIAIILLLIALVAAIVIYLRKQNKPDNKKQKA